MVPPSTLAPCRLVQNLCRSNNSYRVNAAPSVLVQSYFPIAIILRLKKALRGLQGCEQNACQHPLSLRHDIIHQLRSRLPRTPLRHQRRRINIRSKASVKLLGPFFHLSGHAQSKMSMMIGSLMKLGKMRLAGHSHPDDSLANISQEDGRRLCHYW